MKDVERPVGVVAPWRLLPHCSSWERVNFICLSWTPYHPLSRQQQWFVGRDRHHAEGVCVSWLETSPACPPSDASVCPGLGAAHGADTWLFTCLQTIVIDARAHMLGRLASVVAKQILSGHQIVSTAYILCSSGLLGS
jgi:hypothetical protein